MAMAGVWLVCALVAGALARCDHNGCYDDNLSKLIDDEDPMVMVSRTAPRAVTPSWFANETESSNTTTPKIPVFNASNTAEIDSAESTKPKGRLLNLNIEDVHSVANAIHNQTQNGHKKRPITDLSDVNLDDDDEDNSKYLENGNANDKYFGDFPKPQVPFHPLTNQSQDKPLCKENGFVYKQGERIERGCEETCECSSSRWVCNPRCQHPYIRRGRKLDDPLCFESPIDDCCSIIACATDTKATTTTTQGVELCRFNNDTHTVGATWHVGCQQTCTCEKNSIVTCKPRCPKLMASDKCINVPDPEDVCCEKQVCDVSQDVHEDTTDNNFTMGAATDKTKSDSKGKKSETTMRPLVLAEPITSVKVLQNNSVLVNLIHPNNTDDPIHLEISNDEGKTYNGIQLKYPNIIENLKSGNYFIKTKETGTKFNFTINKKEEEQLNIAMEIKNISSQVGCYHDGKFYEVGEEFHIGCTELCECTGPDTRECAALECPSHVGLELVSKGCVRWAPTPPPSPPDCCPRSARCLSDGTCHYKGQAVPNWSEVPLALTGCEQRCFCENGDLDCQEVCTPLSLLPPQNFRCPPGHHPAHVNISEEDCCKEWGCLKNAGKSQALHSQTTESLMTTPRDYFALHNSRDQIPTIIKTPSTNNERISKNVKPTLLIPISTLPEFSESQNTNFHSKEHSQFKTLDEISKLYELPITKVKPYAVAPLIKGPAIEISSHDNGSEIMVRKNSRFLEENIKQGKTNKDFDEDASHQKLHYDLIQNKLNDLKTSDSNPNIIVYDDKNTVSKIDRSMYPVTNHMQTIETQTHRIIMSTLRYDGIFESMQNMPKKNSINEKNLELETQKPYTKKDVTVTKSPSIKVRTHQTTMRLPLQDSETTIHRKLLPNVKKKNMPDLNLEDANKEVNLGANENLGYSPENSHVVPAGLSTADVPPHIANLPPPGFLPTIPPEIHFPQEDDKYNQNNLHRPGHGPVIPTLRPIPNYGEENKKLTMISLQADSPTSVKMLFGLPPVLVGLKGSVDLRYTDKNDDDLSHWYSQVFAPVDEVLTTSRLEFRLTGLKPSTNYRLKGKLFLHSLPVEPESEVFNVRTLDLPMMEEKQRDVDSQLTVVEVNDTTARLTWRHFTDDELPFIDGIQVRYRPVGQPIYTMTELLHHSRSSADLKELKPGSRYEASLVLIPPLQAATELRDLKTVEFTTAPHVDPYNWSVTIEANAVGSQAAELHWQGIPEPAERWVRVYRAAHECGTGRAQEHDAFRLATRDQPSVITITGLKADTRCRVWLELFLVNGKVKTSNVLEITTKSLDSDNPIDNTIEASSVSGSREVHSAGRGDYYGALVVVGVVAALGALASLLLLLVVIRRHRPHSVPITPVPTVPRDSSLPPYDNPAFKLELQQETMDL